MLTLQLNILKRKELAAKVENKQVCSIHVKLGLETCR